ncbi:MAG: lipopolysaccharide biosynthesis protein [Parvibaculum sp.]|nr:lipopolysaccharide biosynthesis protein [Parvibaculum sp.]
MQPGGGKKRVTRTLSDRSVSGFFWAFSGAGVQSVLKMLVLAILARLLTPHDFGVVGAAAVVISFLNTTTQLGVGPAIVQRADLEDVHIRTGQTLSLAMGFVTGAIFYFAAPLIESLYRIDGLAGVVRTLAFVFPLKGMAVVAEGLLQRNMRFRAMAMVSTVSYVLGYAPVAIGLAMLGYGPQALAFGVLAQAALTRVSYRFLIRQPFSLAINMVALRQLLSYGGGHTLAKLGNFTALNADYFIVGRWLGAEALGLYARAYQLIMQPTNLFGTVVDSVLFPAMSSVQDDKLRLARVYERLTAAVVLVTLPLSMVMIVLADDIILTVLGGQWGGVVLPFQILISMLAFRTAYKLSDTLSRSLGTVYRRAWRQWVYAGAVLGGAMIGQAWGVSGVAVGVGAAILLNYLLMYQLCYVLIDLSPLTTLRTLFRYSLIGMGWSGVALAGKLALLEAGAPKPVILIVVGTVLALVALGAFRYIPSLFGEEGRWLKDTFMTKMQQKLRRPAKQ